MPRLKKMSELLWINAVSCWCGLERPHQLCCRPSRVISSQGSFPFSSHPLFFTLACVIKISVSQSFEQCYFCAPVAETQRKGAKRDQKWQEKEGRAVNLQTVVLGMPGVSCDSQANIMVWLYVAQWEFWGNGAI